MGTKTVEAWVCDKCGHVWLKSAKTPVYCAKCKTRRWNDSAKTSKNRASFEMPQWSEAKLREMAKAEDGAFVGVGATPYNLAVLDIVKTQRPTGYAVADSHAGSRATIHAANAQAVQPATGYPGHADGCACFRCRKVRG